MKPCPFCGSTVGLNFVDSQGCKWGNAVCPDCGAMGPEVRTNYDVGENAPWHEEATKEWNTRAKMEAEG